MVNTTIASWKFMGRNGFLSRRSHDSTEDIQFRVLGRKNHDTFVKDAAAGFRLRVLSTACLIWSNKILNASINRAHRNFNAMITSQKMCDGSGNQFFDGYSIGYDRRLGHCFLGWCARDFHRCCQSGRMFGAFFELASKMGNRNQ
jgi:hypothetical protein